MSLRCETGSESASLSFELFVRGAERISGGRDRGDVYMNSDEDLFAVRDGEALEEMLG